GIGLFLWSAGDAVGDFTGVVPGLLLDRFPIDGEGLPEVRQVEVAVERGSGQDLPDLDTPVFEGGISVNLVRQEMAESCGQFSHNAGANNV
ncbi:MAG: hypothetical protein ACREX9_09410, partial [Gammaproteobacteria bacterium]